MNLRTEAIFRAVFAPDGQTVVYSAAREGNRPELFVARPDNPVPQAMGFRDTQLLNISSNGEMAVLIRAKFLSAMNNHVFVTKGDLEETILDFMPPAYPHEIELQNLVAVLEGKDA